MSGQKLPSFVLDKVFCFVLITWNKTIVFQTLHTNEVLIEPVVQILFNPRALADMRLVMALADMRLVIILCD